MRPGTTPGVLDALAKQGITTFLAARLEFANETIGVWTGGHPIEPQGTADSLLDGLRFEPLEHGVAVAVGDNSFSYNGSGALEVALAIPSAPSTVISASMVIPAEYQGRNATLWRALLIQPDPLAEATWLFRRVRSGTMDAVEVQGDGTSHIFKLTIESHASMISAATQQTYLNQKTYDPLDQSQTWAATSANGDPKTSITSVTTAATPIYGQLR